MAEEIMTIVFWKIVNRIFRPGLKVDYGDGVYAPEGFNGLWEVYWPNGQLKFKAIYIDGEENGDVTCWWENGKLCQFGKSVNGISTGAWRDYMPDGYEFKRTIYEDNENFIVEWFDPEGSLIGEQKFEDSIEISQKGELFENKQAEPPLSPFQ